MNALLTNPRAFALIIALIIVSGLSALSSLPRDEDPHIANRHAFVMTEFPGASAERVEALVTEVLETSLREIPEVRHIISRSSAGFSSITVELKDVVVSDQTGRLWAEVRDKLEQAVPFLPAGAKAPFLEERRSYPFTMIVALTWQFDAMEPDLLTLGRYAEDLESRLRSLPGTDFISIHGAPQEEITVDVDATKAGLLGLSPHQIGLMVNQSDAKVSAGEIHNSRLRVAVEVEGALDTIERIRKIPLRQSTDGSAVLVGDIAEVSRQAKTPSSDLAIVNGKSAVVVGVRMLSDQRSDVWSARVRGALQAIQQELPANVKIETIFDQEVYTSERLSSLTGNLVLGFILILVVLLFTLGWRSALIVSAALPLTVLFALACMHFTGLPIHQMSITGLIVALGIMVDNAIVMVDTVSRYKHQGRSGLHATQAAIKHLWIPLLGSTLTTVLAFLPIVIMPGASGEFVGAIGLTVIFSLIGSYLISHMVIAGMAGRFLVFNVASDAQDGVAVERGTWWREGLRLPSCSPHFLALINWALGNPGKLLVLVSLLPLLGLGMGSQLPQQFFPPSDRDMINLEVYLPAASSIDQTKALTEKLSAEILQETGIKSLHWFIGRSSPMFYYNLQQGKDNSQYYAQAMFTAEHFSDANRLVPLLQRKLDDKFPEAQIIIRRLEQGPPFDAPVEIRIMGPNLEVLKDSGEQLRRRFLALQDVVHVRTSLSESVPKLWLSVNENLASAGQLSLTGVAEQIQEGVDGAITGSVLEGTQSLPVRVRAHGQNRIDMGRVHSWLLVPGGANTATRPIPISAISDIDIRPEIGVIPRRDGERINTVQLYIRDGVLPAVVLARVTESLEALPLSLPSGYRLEYAGQEEKRDESIGKLMSSVGLVFILLVVSLVTAFNSFRLSLVIMLVAVQAAGLGMLALTASGAPFGFTSIIGLMGLIGLAINAAIVILAELKIDRQACSGDPGAIAKGVMSCSRHIISTTITTVMGFMPLILSGGGFWPPFAFVIAGGTVMTTIISFFFVPVMFSLMTRKRSFYLDDSLLDNEPEIISLS